jgi:flagellar biosynthesis protein FlhA
LVKILDTFKEENPKIVSDLVPDIMPLGTVLKVLQNLLREGVSVRDLRSILETLAEFGTSSKDPEALTEYARQSLYRTITERIKSSQGDVPLFTLDRSLEESVARSILHTDHGTQLNLDPKVTQTILASLNEKIEEATSQGEKMVVLCSPVIRRHFKKLTEKFIPNMIVVSHNELSPEVNIRSLGTVRL